MTARRTLGLAALAAMAISACAPLPPEPDTTRVEPAPPAAGARFEPALRTSRGAFAARHAELAQKALAAGDLATAEDHFQVLVLVEPGNAGYRQSLESTREAIRKAVREQWQAGQAARRNGDTGKARDAFLHVLALQPDHADAARALRELEQAAMARTQAERAARVRATEDIVAGARARAAQPQPTPNDGYDLEQRLEIARAGDLQAGLRELRAWVDANPSDRAGRQRVGAVIAERARDAESKGLRETAVSLYEQAATLAGSGQPDWAARTQSLRKALGEQYYADGMKLYRTDLAGAIKHWETGAKYDPSNANLQMRLREAKLAQQKLQKIGDRPSQ